MEKNETNKIFIYQEEDELIKVFSANFPCLPLSVRERSMRSLQYKMHQQ